MAKPELGLKRLCANCGAKFYDLNRDPIVCPKCQTVFVPPAAAAPRPRPEQQAPVIADVELPATEPAEAEFVSLEDAEKEEEGAVPVAEDAEVEEEALEDDTFIVPEEEDEEDVTDIIGEGIEDDEET